MHIRKSEQSLVCNSVLQVQEACKRSGSNSNVQHEMEEDENGCCTFDDNGDDDDDDNNNSRKGAGNRFKKKKGTNMCILVRVYVCVIKTRKNTRLLKSVNKVFC